MANTPCMVKHITLITISNGAKYQSGVNKDGVEVDSVQSIASYEPDKRVYYCSNCRTTFDGHETFDETKKHLGTFPID